MKIRYIKGTRVIGGVSIGEGENFTFSSAQMKDPYINKRIKKALLEGRIEEVDTKADNKGSGETEPKKDDKEREALMKRAEELGLKPHPNIGIEKLTKMIAEKEAANQ